MARKIVYVLITLIAAIFVLPATFSYWGYYHNERHSWGYNLFYHHLEYGNHYYHNYGYHNWNYFYHHPKYHQPWWVNDTLVKERIHYVKQINPYAAERMEEMIELKRKYFNEHDCPCHHFWR